MPKRPIKKADLSKFGDHALARENARLREELMKMQTDLRKIEVEQQAMAAEHKLATSTLKTHEKREQRRMDGLKKAQATRKKGSTKK